MPGLSADNNAAGRSMASMVGPSMLDTLIIGGATPIGSAMETGKLRLRPLPSLLQVALATWIGLVVVRVLPDGGGAQAILVERNAGKAAWVKAAHID